MTQENFTHAFERIGNLVAIFKQNESHYLSPGYNEADARKDFIDKFWIALGWDVNHETQTDPYKQEVKVERGVAVSELRKRADYAFLAPNFRDVRFFVEAKKPHVGLDNPLYYFQTIRYGWNSHVPISVLTDFEEFRVLDCRYKPNIKTSPGHALLKFHYTDYTDLDKFRNIYYLFSRDAVLAGSIESFAQGLPKISKKRVAARGVAKDEHQSIDEAFLKELDEYREELARAFKRKNPELDGEALTEVTQRTLDRLVFMRFLEDKLIETEPLIEDLNRKGDAWENFISTSRRLDKIYNGIIFKEHPLLDKPSFSIDEKTFKKISDNLSHTSSPYDFNAIPIHILGSIYERFLGKVIVATAKQARVEEKPEVRKAGGVYYTPEYIVRYIVDNTVGKLIENKTPEEIRPMHFADIACGSGSFLLGIYETLLRYHTAYYNRTKKNQAEGRKAGCLQTETGALRLSLLQKRTILLNNIYGVDIDPQAVEVAQLSLYLKLLEDETIASAHQQQMALRQALLPSLSKNIICGNSLIGWDVLDGKLFDSGDERKLNPMNFQDAFPEVMKGGGFDAIVGNPPYIGFHGFKEDKEYLKRTFISATGKFDYYLPFIEKGIIALKHKGDLGFICPTNFTKRGHGLALRHHLKSHVKIQQICDFEDVQVFAGALNYTGIFILENTQPSDEHKFLYKRRLLTDLGMDVRQTSLSDDAWIFRQKAENTLVAKVKKQAVSALGQMTSGIAEGIVTGNNDVFLLPKATAKDLGLYGDILRPCVRGRQIRRYRLEESSEVVIYPYRLADRRTEVIPERELKELHPTWKYLTSRRKDLSGRAYFEASSKAWYELWCQRDMNLLAAPKIIVPELSASNRFALSDQSQFYGDTVCGITLLPQVEESLLYVLAVLNSKLIEFYYKQTTVPKANKFFIYKTMFLKNIPIRRIKFSNRKEESRHDRMVQLVDQMLAAKQQLASAQTERDKRFYESKCATLDRQIDSLVYELYDLTPEEIALVETG